MNKVLSQTGHVKELDKEKGEITAYVSTKTRDRSDEVLEPDGVDLRNYRKNPVVLWAHDYSMPPIGKALWVKKDESGVIAKFKFASTPFAQEIKTLYEEKILSAFSVGFVPKEHEDGDGEKKPRRTYKKWEMLEFSAVPVPANPDAVALAISKGLIKTEEVKKALGIEDVPLQEFNDEPKEETVSKEVVEESEDTNALDEVLSENKLLTEENKFLTKENADLRYKVYRLTEEKQTRLSEITAANIEKTILEVAGGVIRKAQGKLD